MRNNKEQHASGSATLYYVEARYTGGEHVKMHNGMALTHTWQRINTVERESREPVAVGYCNAVPSTQYPRFAREHGWLELTSAVALATRFQVSDDILGGLCVETRLVKLTVKWEYSATEEGVSEPYSLREQCRGGVPVQPRGEQP